MTAYKFCVGLLSRCNSSPEQLFRHQVKPILLRSNPLSTSCVNFSESHHDKQYPSNSSITPTMVHNRNPRNLEKMRIGDKPMGYLLDKPGKNFWNKVTLDITSQHISARLVHFRGMTPISVSTKEWCIKKYLYSTNDACAAKAVGQVLAQRCLQAGIMEIACFFTEEEKKKEKVSVFLQAIDDGGVALKEPPQAMPDHFLHDTHKLPDTPWDVHEGVDDNVFQAFKYRGGQERKQKIPCSSDMIDITDEKNQLYFK